MDPPLSTSSHRKRAVSGPSHTSTTITRSSYQPPPSPSTSTRSKKPKLQSPLELGHASSSRPAPTKRARKPVATRRTGEATAATNGSTARTPAVIGGARKGKAKLMMEEEEQMELTKLDPDDDRAGVVGGGEGYVYDLVAISEQDLEAQVFSFLHAAYGHLRASLIARVADPWVDYADGKSLTSQASLLLPVLQPILVKLKPLLLRRCLDVLKDGDEDLYAYDSPICSEEMLDREEFIYEPLRTLLHTLQSSEVSAKLATPGPRSKTAGLVNNAVGWTLLKIGRQGIDDPRWETDCLEEGEEGKNGLDGERFRVTRRRGESAWEEEPEESDEERDEDMGEEAALGSG